MDPWENSFSTVATVELYGNNGASIEDVGALLGHASIATTATYLARMEGEEDKEWRELAYNFTVEFILRWSGCSQP